MSELEKVKEWLVSIGFEVVESQFTNDKFISLIKRHNMIDTCNVCEIGLHVDNKDVKKEYIGINAYCDDEKCLCDKRTRSFLETMDINDLEFTKKVLKSLIQLQLFFP